jgi:hypothetical protein
LLARVAENSYLAGDGLVAGPLDQRFGASITYRIAIGPQQGRKVFTVQALAISDKLQEIVAPEWLPVAIMPLTPASRAHADRASAMYVWV